MNKFFPNVETAIIVVFILCVMLWGASRCKRQKDELVNKSVTEGSVLADTLASPAAAKPMPKALPPLDPAVATTTPPPLYSPTPPANPGQALPQPVPQQNIPNTSTAPPPTPDNRATTTKAKSPNATTTPSATEQTGSALYVLRSGLNVRAQPTVKSKSLGKLKLHDQVYFLDEVSQTSETVRLENGTEITKPWFKVKTKRGTVGWVHGSGVDFYKRKPQDVF
jgi:Bacterial SH3 domain